MDDLPILLTTNKSTHNWLDGGVLLHPVRSPLPHDKVEDEMIQCVVCEDWFHSRSRYNAYMYVHMYSFYQHLGCPLHPLLYQEMVCDGCMARVAFLRAHQIHTTSHTIHTTSPATKRERWTYRTVVETINLLALLHLTKLCVDLFVVRSWWVNHVWIKVQDILLMGGGVNCVTVTTARYISLCVCVLYGWVRTL